MRTKILLQKDVCHWREYEYKLVNKYLSWKNFLNYFNNCFMLSHEVHRMYALYPEIKRKKKKKFVGPVEKLELNYF